MKTRKFLILSVLIYLFTFFAGEPVIPDIVSAAKTTVKVTSEGKWVITGSKLKFKTTDGQFVKGKLKKIGSSWFYFNSRGYVVTGKKKIDNRVYFFKKNGDPGKKGKMLTGWRTIGSKKYYFRVTNKDGLRGAAYSGEWVTIGGKVYYFNSDGTMNPNVMTEQEFVDRIGKMANKDMKTSGILASVTTAQAILESGYCTTSLGLEAHNLFGMKATLSSNTWRSAWKGKTFNKMTQEYMDGRWITIEDTFRYYDTFEESLADHSAYLLSAMNGSRLRYGGVAGNKSYRDTIQIIKDGGYATDPDYVWKICNIIERWNLTQFDKQHEK